MQIGTLVKVSFRSDFKDALGIVVEAYDSPKGLWYVYWLSGYSEGNTILCNACAVEVVNV